jgi:hypothetical protein
MRHFVFELLERNLPQVEESQEESESGAVMHSSPNLPRVQEGDRN